MSLILFWLELLVYNAMWFLCVNSCIWSPWTALRWGTWGASVAQTSCASRRHVLQAWREHSGLSCPPNCRISTASFANLTETHCLLSTSRYVSSLPYSCLFINEWCLINPSLLINHNKNEVSSDLYLQGALMYSIIPLSSLNQWKAPGAKDQFLYSFYFSCLFFFHFFSKQNPFFS